jgi:hypothetical protein
MPLDLLEIYADEAGETHFRNASVELEANHYAPPSPPLEISAETAVTTSLFLVAPPGWDDAFHATPRRQYAVLLEGGLSVTASDGETVTMKPGDMVLLNDFGSKGHLSKVQGDRPARFLMIGCPAES